MGDNWLNFWCCLWVEFSVVCCLCLALWRCDLFVVLPPAAAAAAAAFCSAAALFLAAATCAASAAAAWLAASWPRMDLTARAASSSSLIGPVNKNHLEFAILTVLNFNAPCPAV